MLTIERGRTNAVPPMMLIVCIGLFLLRTVSIYYGAFFQPVPKSTIVWKQPQPIDRSRRDVLSRPNLYYFCDTGDNINTVFSELFDNLLFQNREVATIIKESFNPMKVVLKGEKSDSVSKSLKTALHISNTPSVYITLTNGETVDSGSWQSDRMFVAFLKDALREAPSTAAYNAMRHNDYVTACRAFQLSHDNYKESKRPSLYWAIYWSIALRHTNDDAKARKVLGDSLELNKKIFSFDKSDDWPAPCLRYLLGDITSEELLKRSVDHKAKQKWEHDEIAQYLIGVNLLFEGKTELAKKELRKVAENRSAHFCYSSRVARAELRALGDNYPVKDDDDQQN